MTEFQEPKTAPESDLPLHGIRVVEMSSYVSVPFAGSMLRNLGATVIKIEPPEGDSFRRFGLRYQNLSAVWVNINHGKESEFLDLKSDQDRQRLLSLLESTDVLLQNLRPGVAASVGLDSSSLAPQFPKLICVTVTGYGHSGPKSHLPVFDGLIQAASGMADIESDGHPRPTKAYVVDKISALFVVQSVLAALYARETTGRGSVIDLAMLDMIAFFNFADHGQDRTFLPPAPPVDQKSAPARFIEASDGYVAVVPVTGRQIRACLEAVGHLEWQADLKACRNPAEMMELFYQRLETETKRLSASECEALFQRYSVPTAAVLTFDQHLADPQTIHNHIYAETASPVGPIRTVRYPARVDGCYLPVDGNWDQP